MFNRFPLRMKSVHIFGLSLAAASACGKKVRGPSTTNYTSEIAGSKNGSSGTSGGQSNDAFPNVQTQVDKIAKESREQDEFLSKRIDEESKARLEADESLKKSISELDSRVTSLAGKLDTEVARLDKKDLELGALIVTKADEQKKAITELEDKMKKGFEEQKSALTSTIDGLVAQLGVGQKENADLLLSLKRQISMNNNDLKTFLKDEINNNLAAARKKLSLLSQAIAGKLASNAESYNRATDAKTKEMLTISKTTLEKRQTELSELSAKTDADLKTALLAKVDADLAPIRVDLEDEKAQVSKIIVEAVGNTKADVVAQFTEADDRLRDAINRKLESELGNLSGQISSLKSHVDTNYATKAELNAVNMVVKNLQNVTAFMNFKIDYNDAMVKARLSAEVSALRSDLQKEIAGVQANVDAVNNKLNEHIKTYQAKMKELNDLAEKEADEVRALICALQVQDEQNLKALNEKLGKLTNRVADAESYAQEVRKSLGNKILELEQADAYIKQDIKEATENASKQLVQAIAAEQNERQALSKKVDELAKEVKRVSDVANQGLQLSQANEKAIKGLGDELTAARKEFGAKLDQLKSEVQGQMNEIRGYAEEITANLGKDIQKQLAEAAAGVAELRGKDAAAGDEIARQISKIVPDADIIKTFRNEAKPLQQNLIDKAAALYSGFAMSEGEFLNAIDYVHGKKGISLAELNKSFQPIAALSICGGITGLEPEFPGRNSTVADHEWYFHLAREYNQLLIAGARTGKADIDNIFFGILPLADGASLSSAVALQGIPSRATGAGGTCVSKVQDWARGLILGTSQLSIDLRKALLAHAELRNVVQKQIEPRYKALKSPGDALIASIRKSVSARLSSQASFDEFLATKPEPGMIATIAQVVAERAEVQYQIAANQSNSDNIISLAKSVAKVEDEANKTANAVANAVSTLDNKIKALNDRLSAIADSHEERLDKLEGSVTNAFSLIAGIATRLGYADIVALAKAEAGKLGGEIDKRLLFPIECKATSHFFNYANENQPLQRCDTGVDTGNGVIGDSGKCRTVIRNHTTVTQVVNTHTDYYNTTYYGGVNWVNQRCPSTCITWNGSWDYLGSYWSSSQRSWVTGYSVSTSSDVQHSFVGVLRAPILSPEHPEAKSLLARPAGAPFPADRKTMLGLRVFGNAYSWKITDMSGKSVTVDAQSFRKTDNKSGIVYEIPASMFLAKSDGTAGFTETARVEALDATGKSTGAQCLHNMNGGTYNTSSSNTVNTNTSASYYTTHYYYNYRAHYYYSPIVLDLSGTGTLETTPPNRSEARFDLQGEGTTEKVGWIKPTAAFLAMDLNGNGKIDSGAELFGNHTKLPSGQKAIHGYQALAQYDKTGTGFLDKTNPSFSKLLVWRDINEDGVSQPNELLSLAKMGITKISVEQQDVPLAQQTQGSGRSKNLVLYQSRFWGPKTCGTEGCKSFDVYFGVDASVGVASRK